MGDETRRRRDSRLALRLERTLAGASRDPEAERGITYDNDGIPCRRPSNTRELDGLWLRDRFFEKDGRPWEERWSEISLERADECRVSLFAGVDAGGAVAAVAIEYMALEPEDEDRRFPPGGALVLPWSGAVELARTILSRAPASVSGTDGPVYGWRLLQTPVGLPLSGD